MAAKATSQDILHEIIFELQEICKVKYLPGFSLATYIVKLIEKIQIAKENKAKSIYSGEELILKSNLFNVPQEVKTLIDTPEVKQFLEESNTLYYTPKVAINKAPKEITHDKKEK